MDKGDRFQIGFVFFVEVIQEGLVLEEVGIDFTVVEGLVGQHVVGEFFDFQSVTFFFKFRCQGVENFLMGGRAGADGDDLIIPGSCRGGIGLAACRLLTAASGQGTDGHKGCQ